MAARLAGSSSQPYSCSSRLYSCMLTIWHLRSAQHGRMRAWMCMHVDVCACIPKHVQLHPHKLGGVQVLHAFVYMCVHCTLARACGHARVRV